MNFRAQLGVELGVMSNIKQTGVIWDDGLPEFNNYTYSYEVNHLHLAAKGKLLPPQNYYLTPWISASVGAAWNQAHNYTSTPTIFEATPTPGFGSSTTRSMMFALGIGVQHVFANNAQVGIGYEWSALGKSQLGTVTGQTIGDSGLSLSQLYTNAILMNVTYAFG